MKILNNSILKVSISISILAIIAVCSFLVANLCLPNKTLFAADEDLNNGNGLIIVESRAEASEIAGYEIVSPAFLPEDLNVTPIITVEETGISDVKRVMQVWNSTNGDVFFCLIQDPTLDGIGNSEKGVDIGGILGERKYTPGNSNRCATLSLFWRYNGMSYVITGIVTKELSEDILEKIAVSTIAK